MPPLPRQLRALGVLALALSAAAETRAQPAPALDQYLCLRGAASRQVDRSLRFAPHDGLLVRDRLIAAASATPAKVDLKKAAGLCLPVGAPDAPLVDATTHLELYDAHLSRTKPRQPKLAPSVQHASNALGSEDLALKQIEEVLIPSTAVFDPPPAAVAVPTDADDFTCYHADRARGGRVPPTRLSLATGIGTLQLDVRAPVRLCVPAGVDGPRSDPSVPSQPQALACYRATLARTKPKQASPFPQEVATANRFGTEQLTLASMLELCVPSTLHAGGPTPTPTATATTVGPTPTPTPGPDFTLRIDPSDATVDIGQSVHFKATADFPNGDHEDFTERVVWSSDSDAALVPNEPGDKGRVDTVDGGRVVISVVDPATGVSSTTSGGDAALTVNWTLERIELSPLTATRGAGESIRLRATGHFANGFTRLVTQKVVFASSDEAIAHPTNAPEESEHSRIIAVGTGTATLSAKDPVTGLTSTATNDDVALTVVPPLERCTILQKSPITLATEHDSQLTAHGFYPGGFERNLTQQVIWSSDAPEVLEAPNTDGDRSRVHALAPGTAHVTAKDSITGLACDTTITFEVGVPLGLSVRDPGYSWQAFQPHRIGDPWHLVAVQGLAGLDWKYVTQKAHFDSSDPTVAAAPNVDGDRGRIDAIGGGTAQITATDPVNGMTSPPVSLKVLDGLTQVEVSFPNFRSVKPLIVRHPFGIRLEAIGHFGDGPAPLDGKDITFVSSNPAVVEVVDTQNPFRPWSFRTIGFGTATITVVDKRTGIASDETHSLPIVVRGPVQSLEIFPAHVTRRAGDYFSFAVVAHFEGGATDVVTQEIALTSSNPAVVDPYYAGGVFGLVSGEAVITAVDPETGISSADSGHAATMTVVGPLQRLRMSPADVTRSVGRWFPFTAVGVDAAGREMNLTQKVTWSSSDPAIAVALNEVGTRSLVKTIAEGTTTISAFDLQDSISSTTTGDDATLVVSGILESLWVQPADVYLTVGESVSLTAIGQLVGGGAVNLTQEVVYSSEDPSVVKAENEPGNRSKVTALAPGTVAIFAHDPGTGLDSEWNNVARVHVVAP